ncbi:MAG: YtxH domain-containing protein [Sulfobacillus acidophilus]|uniref:YtxH domain-containing protein n=1 Tax=Sulfobacillus acidophilus TaxID=53633 RepID=A0A2T2WI37_9FIRM|nr:MAG: YtxH domain-containing protein [Sulfobacillus acidophilus]
MDDRNWDRLSGLIIGAAIGMVAGILLAPSAGTETRNTIKKKTQGTLDQVTGSVRDIRDNLAKKGQELWKRSVTEISLDDSEDLPADDHGHGV